MLLNKLACLIFVVLFEKSYQNYEIPVPEIIIYKPRGFRVSIPHETGIRLFVFHGNINKEITGSQPGDYSKEITIEANGKWTFHDRRTKLNIGDTIHYWLFVLKHGLGYNLHNGHFTVQELVNNPLIQNAKKGYSPSPQENEAQCNNPSNTICLQSIVNVTQSLVQLQHEAETALKKNRQMMDYIALIPNAKKMTITGKIPPEGQASSLVSFVLREKLNMNPVIVAAQRNSDGSIEFEVLNISDKLDILEAAMEKLDHTIISIH